MSVPVIVRPEAEGDVTAVHAELELARPGSGRRFAGRVRAILERLEVLPEVYGIVWQGVRGARVRGFRYVLYYLAFPDRVEVIAVVHGSRDASAWQSRV